MSDPDRGGRTWRTAAVVGLIVALVGWRGVGIDATRVIALVPPEPGVSLRTHEARLALRPLPVLVARDSTLRLPGDVRAELPDVRIRVATADLLRGHLVWRGASVRGAALVVPMGDETALRCDGVAGSAWAEGERGARLDLDAACAWGRLAVGRLRYDGVLRARPDAPVRLRGALIAERVTARGLLLDRLEAQLRIGGDGVRATDLRVFAGDGRLDGWGRLSAGARGHRRALALGGTGNAAERVFVETRMRATGRWVVRARWRGSGDRVSRVQHGVGHGRVTLLDGGVEPLDVGAALLDGLEVWRGRRRRRLRRRFPDVFEGSGLRFDRASARVRVGRGRVVVAPVLVRSESYHAAGQGRLRRDGTVRGRLDVTPSAPLATALVGRGALRAILAGGTEADLVIPLELAGRPGRLRVRPAKHFARDVIRRALGGSTLGDALGQLLDD